MGHAILFVRDIDGSGGHISGEDDIISILHRELVSALFSVDLGRSCGEIQVVSDLLSIDKLDRCRACRHVDIKAGCQGKCFCIKIT